ncbi:unnamed protein product [Ilex paraguariensis]|uniref:Uncharacterized protein n=1 Tax=Ilex paraguariensis TaxID=185542 RepID=A0ABC8R3U1_9AQUA
MIGKISELIEGDHHEVRSWAGDISFELCNSRFVSVRNGNGVFIMGRRVALGNCEALREEQRIGVGNLWIREEGRYGVLEDGSEVDFMVRSKVELGFKGQITKPF